MSRWQSRIPAALVALTIAVTLPLLASPARAVDVSAPVIINEVYGGGGNAGATIRNDFIELYNASPNAVDLSTWSVQYASSAGTSWQKTNLVGTLPAGRTYVVKEAAGTNVAVPEVVGDATGTIAMSGTAGKVALVNNQTTLPATCTGDQRRRQRVLGPRGRGRLRGLRRGQRLRRHGPDSGADQHHRRHPQRGAHQHGQQRCRLHDGGAHALRLRHRLHHRHPAGSDREDHRRDPGHGHRPRRWSASRSSREAWSRRPTPPAASPASTSRPPVAAAPATRRRARPTASSSSSRPAPCPPRAPSSR